MKCKKGYKQKGNKCVRKNKSVAKVLNPKNSPWIIYTLLGIVAIAVFAYGGYNGWFKGTANIINNQNITNYLNEVPATGSGSCTLDLTPNSIYEGDRVTGTIRDGTNTHCYVIANDGSGWYIVYEGDTDATGLLIDTRNIFVTGDFVFRAICDSNRNGMMDTDDCITNSENLLVIERPDDEPPEDDEPPASGFSPGDVVWSGGDSGSINYGDGVNLAVITPGEMGFEVGGPCSLEVRLETNWNYQDENACKEMQLNGVLKQQHLKWDFYDSAGLRYTRTDTYPRGVSENIYPVNYDGVNNWKLQITTLDYIEGCQINYDWEMLIRVAECDE